MKEKLQEYALIAEIIGGVGIIASLIFVGIQLNQSVEETALNTRQMQSDAYAELVNNINAFSYMVIENPEILDVVMKVESNQALTEKENRMIVTMARALTQTANLAWKQYESGIITERDLLMAITPFRSNITRYTAFKEAWENTSSSNPDFLQYLNTLPEYGSDEDSKYLLQTN